MQESTHAVDFRYFQGLVGGHFGKEGREGPGEHGLAATGGPGHKDVMASRRGNFQGPLGVLLSLDVGEVGLIEVGLFFRGFDPIYVVRGKRFVAAEVVYQDRQSGNGKNVDADHDCGLSLIVVGDKHAVEALVLGNADHRQDAVGVPD